MGNLKTIHYYPELREYVGSINAVLIVSYLEACFEEKGRSFYKFMEPCGHGYYKEGESWSEVLHMTGTEFRTAFKHIGTVYKSKREYNRSEDKFQGKMYLSYYDRISKMTYYMRNDDLVNRVLQLVGREENTIAKAATKEEEIAIRYETTEGDEFRVEKKTVESNRTEENKVEEVKEENNHDFGNLGMQYSRNEQTKDRLINNKTNALSGLDNSQDNSLENNKTETKTKTYIHTDYKGFIQDEDAAYRESEGFEESEKHEESEEFEALEEYEEHRETEELRKVEGHRQSEGLQDAPETMALEQILVTIKNLFNQTCPSHDQVLEWTGAQEQKIGQLWWLYDRNLEVFRTAFEKLEISDFLSGRIKNWKASLDWILMPVHFADILGDKYKNFRKASERIDASKGEESEDRWDFDEIERLEQERIDRLVANFVE